MDSEKSFVKGAALLAFSGMVVKGLSAIYRIPITAMVGAEVMGRYTAVFNVFMPFFSLGVRGITPAVSRLCAGRETRGKIVRVKNGADGYFLKRIFIFYALSLCFAFAYSNYTGKDFILYGMALLSLNLFLAGKEAIYKGVSQGSGNMALTAKANMTESLSKCLLGISRVYLAAKYGGENRENLQFFALITAILIGGLICVLYMKRGYDKHYKAIEPERKVNPHEYSKTSVPIAMSALAVSRANFFDAAVCLPMIERLPEGLLSAAYPYASFTARQDKAVWLYGIYRGMCMTVRGIIPSICGGVGTSGLPILSKYAATGNIPRAEKQADKMIKLCAYVALPAGMFLYSFGGAVISAVYGKTNSRTMIRGEFLKIASVTAIFNSMVFSLNAVLNSFGRSKAVFKNMLIALAVKLPLGFILCQRAEVNIKGCLYSGACFALVTFALAYFAAEKSVKIKILSRAAVPFAVSYVFITFIKFLQIKYCLAPLPFTLIFGGLFRLLYSVTALLWLFFIEKLSR